MTLLEYIKNYKKEFFNATISRYHTSPNKWNKERHIKLHTAIGDDDWDTVVDIISDPWYQNPLEGVICYIAYYDIDSEVINAMLLCKGKRDFV